MCHGSFTQGYVLSVYALNLRFKKTTPTIRGGYVLNVSIFL